MLTVDSFQWLEEGRRCKALAKKMATCWTLLYVDSLKKVGHDTKKTGDGGESVHLKGQGRWNMVGLVNGWKGDVR